MRRYIVLSCCLIFLLSACDFLNNFLPPEDTCSQGYNMSNIRTPDFDVSLSTPTLKILWDIGTEKGADLPASYFAKWNWFKTTDNKRLQHLPQTAKPSSATSKRASNVAGLV